MNPVDRLARHVLATGYESLPPSTVASTKKFVLDSIGVGIGGSRGPWVAELTAAQDRAGDGGATVWVTGERLSPAAAALVNAYQIHNAEFDCVHEGAVVHPVTVVLATCMAEIERRRRGGEPTGGRELIAAVALGVDVACHLGVASLSGLRFFRPGTAGGFGATAALGRLRGLGEPVLASAFGIVYSQLCGTMQAHTEGSPLLGMQMGFNARNATLACDLAARGIPGPRDVLLGPFGYFGLFESAHELDVTLERLARVWRIEEVAHKPWPSGRATHGIMNGCASLQAAHGFGHEAIESVTARVPSLIHHLVGRPVTDEMDVNYARLCARYATARLLMTGRLGHDDFEPPVRQHPASLALARRIAIEVDDNPDPNALTPVSVAVTLAGGERHETTVETVYGHPDRPMSRDAYLDKFRHNWSYAGMDAPAGERVIARLEALEEEDDVASIVDDLVRR